MLRGALAAFALVTLGAPHGATAGTASFIGSVVTYQAAPGELNDVSIRALDLGDADFTPPRTYEVRDTGAPVLPGPGCIALDADAAACTKPSGAFLDNFVIRTDDLDDRASVALLCPNCGVGGGPFFEIALYGESGADTLTGGAAGTGGTDLYGGTGNDTLLGGENHDFLEGGPGADTMDGGPGRFTVDGVSYAHHAESIRVTFDGSANDGAVGEGDNVLPSVEAVVGGPGNDTLIGDRRRNVFLGRGGNDTLVGSAGADRLKGGSGSDSVRAGPGPDRVNGQAGDDKLAGGTGSDRIAGEAGNDLIRAEDGNDFLFGGRGRDLMRGGSGRDTIYAWKDQEKDRVLGGPDRDSASVDRSLDLWSGIELIHFS